MFSDNKIKFNNINFLFFYIIGQFILKYDEEKKITEHNKNLKFSIIFIIIWMK